MSILPRETPQDPTSRDAGGLPITELFTSIQGEGGLVGTPSSFVRVRGCNLRCGWCDTPHSSWEPEGAVRSLDELVAYCAEGPQHVVLTGGEPLLFAPLARLSALLKRRGHHITVETAGTVWCDDLRCDLMSISPKLRHAAPHRGGPSLAARHEAARWAPEIAARLCEAFTAQLKFVVRVDPDALAEDLAEIDAFLAAAGLESFPPAQIFLMPEGVDPAALADAYRALSEPARARGYRIGQRLHLALFGHTPGT
ncbi:MAG: 7-carboxy-7-deazaguanine synthase QueE [Nannocystaceae bacterium]